MSIFLSQNPSKPQSYTKDLRQSDGQLDYQSMKKEIRGKICDNYKDFDKVGNGYSEMKSPQSPIKRSISQAGLYFTRNSQLKSQFSPLKERSDTKQSSAFIGFSKTQTAQSSPMKINGLQKQMSSIGNKSSTSGGEASGRKQFQNHFDTLFSSKLSSPLEIQHKTQSSRTQSSISIGNSFNVQKMNTQGASFNTQSNLSQIVPIQKLVEIQNLLELTPTNDLNLIPRHYLDELLRVAQAITRTLRYHHDQQRLKL